MSAQNKEAHSLNAIRPLFLAILCGIGFLGSLTTVLENSIGYFSAEYEVARIEMGTKKTLLKNIFSQDQSTGYQSMNLANLNTDNFKKFCLGEIVAALLCIVGTILMWLMKKNGFYSFTLGSFFNLITHFLLFGEQVGAMGLSFIWAVFCLVLVLLYSRFINIME